MSMELIGRAEALKHSYVDEDMTVKAIPLDRVEQIKEEVIDKSFSVVNPNDTYEYINVIDLGSLEKIIDKAIKEQTT